MAMVTLRFDYKHTETIGYVKNYGQTSREFLSLVPTYEINLFS